MSSKNLKVTIDTHIDASANFTAASYTDSGSVRITINTSEKVRFSLRDDSNQLSDVNDSLDLSQTLSVSFAGTAAIANHGYRASFTDRAGNKSSNSDTFDLQNPPPADPTAALKDGGYIVTFFKPALDSEDGFDIYAQRYTENGQETGEAFVVNTYRVDDQIIPDVTGLEDGGYVVSWQSFGQDGDEYGIYAQRFDVNDQAVGEEFKVSETNVADQHRAEITSLNNGGFVLSWVSESTDGSERSIYSRFYDSHGDALGPETQVNSDSGTKANYPTLTSLSNGNAVIVWEQSSDQGAKLHSAIYSASGELISLNGNFIQSDAWQMQAHIDAMEDGGFVVSWLSNTEDAKLQTMSQVFDANGQARSQALIISEDSQNIRPEVAALNDGSFIVSWLENGEVYFANYSADGDKLSESSISASANNELSETHALALNNGGFLITWVELNEGAPVAVYGMQYDQDGDAMGDRFVVEPLSQQLISHSLLPMDSATIEMNYQLGSDEEILINDWQDTEYAHFISEELEGIDLSDVFTEEDSTVVNFGEQQYSNNGTTGAKMDWFSLDAAYNFGTQEGIFSLEDLQTAHLGI